MAAQRALPPLPLPAEAGLVAGRELAKELLQRGVFFALAAGWLTDRLYEAGADDVVVLPTWVRGGRDTCVWWYVYKKALETGGHTIWSPQYVGCTLQVYDTVAFGSGSGPGAQLIQGELHAAH